MNIQWYPGHMTKAKRNMANDVKLVDIVIELLDARTPYSTQNPDIKKLTAGKKRLILLNKSDLADTNITSQWIRFFRSEGCEVVALDSRRRDAINLVRQAIYRLGEDKRERDKKRGLTETRAVKALICGIPNVGKSTFINTLAGRASAKTGNKPGVTKGNQWLTVGNDFLLLDTPGVLWPKFEDKNVGLHLAMIGAINDQIVNLEELSMELLTFIDNNYPGLLEEKYAISKEALEEAVCEADQGILGVNPRALAFLTLIASSRGCIRKGAAPDYERCSKLLIDDFRSGRLGEISLERPIDGK